MKESHRRPRAGPAKGPATAASAEEEAGEGSTFRAVRPLPLARPGRAAHRSSLRVN